MTHRHVTKAFTKVAIKVMDSRFQEAISVMKLLSHPTLRMSRHRMRLVPIFLYEFKDDLKQ